MSEMIEITLGDYIDVLTDYHSGGSYKTLKEKTKILYEPDYAVMVRTLNFENDDFYNNLIYCDKDSYDFLSYSHLLENDILMNKIANPGSVYIMPKVNYRATCAMNLFLIRCKDINQRYMFYVMKNSEDYIKKQAHGTTTKTITKDEVRNLKFLIHKDFNDRERIANFLTLIDKKIENNNKINRKLEQLAKTIYEYWFLQYDFPNVYGKAYRTSGGEMRFSKELDTDVPAGWVVEPISNYILKSKNGDWGAEEKTNDDDIKVNCFRGADFPCITDSYTLTAPVRYIKSKNSDRILEDGDLVIEISGGSPTQATGRIGYISKEFLTRTENVMNCSNFCRAITPLNKRYQYWLYQTWKLFYDKGVMFNYESKTTGIKNLLFDEFVNNVYVASPDEEILEKYQSICEMYYDAIQKNLRQNQELDSMKDYLMPMLMNGQLYVN